MARRSTVEDLVPLFLPKTDLQASAMEVCATSDVTFLLGPAGCGKTHIAMAAALTALASPKSKITKIVITRPIVEAGESLGHLPGEIMEKVHPYMRPIYDCVNRIVKGGDRVIDNYVEVAPLAYMRGTTFNSCIAILDEAQNCTMFQMRMFLSRLGADAKLIITGDPDQSDIGKKSALTAAVDKLHNVDGIGVVRFSDQHNVRHRLVSQILAKLGR